MASILEGSLAQTVANAVSFLFMDATLFRDSVAEGTEPGEPGEITPVSYPCKAIHEEWSRSVMLNGTVATGDRKILILATTLAVDPLPKDRILLRGEVFTVVPGNTSGVPAVETDPAKATWSLRCRK